MLFILKTCAVSFVMLFEQVKCDDSDISDKDDDDDDDDVIVFSDIPDMGIHS